jgi:hypothetical protein
MPQNVRRALLVLPWQNLKLKLVCLGKRANGQVVCLGKRANRKVLSLAIWGAIQCAHASEAVLADTYLVETLPKGAMEFEQWLVNKRGKASGEYLEWYSRTEFEYGVTNRFQLAAYINARYQNVYRSTVDGRTEADFVPEEFSYNRPFDRYKNTHFDSVSIEAIYQLKSPLTDGYGLGIYVEPSLGPRFRELELRLLLQKNLLDDRLALVANVGFEMEQKRKTGVADQLIIPGEGAEEPGEEEEEEDGPLLPRWDKNNELFLRLGASYLAAPNWHVGAELSTYVEYEGHTLASDKREHTSWFFGPTLAYANQAFFASLSFEHQLPITHVFEAEYLPELVGDRLYGNERSRNRWTLKFGVPF